MHTIIDKSQVPEISLRAKAYSNYYYLGSNTNRSDRPSTSYSQWGSVRTHKNFDTTWIHTVLQFIIKRI